MNKTKLIDDVTNITVNDDVLLKTIEKFFSSNVDNDIDIDIEIIKTKNFFTLNVFDNNDSIWNIAKTIINIDKTIVVNEIDEIETTIIIVANVVTKIAIIFLN